MSNYSGFISNFSNSYPNSGYDILSNITTYTDSGTNCNYGFCI